MTEEMEKLALELPSPIARPFLLAQKLGDQRKDLQRFCLENLVSFLATVAVSDLLDYFQKLRDSEKPDTKEIDTIKILQNSERLTGIDLEQMALGKWVGLLRDTTAESKACLKELKIPELIDFYNAPKEKKTPAAELVDKLVTKRNNDAHGSPIAADKLSNELDERGEMLEKVIEAHSTSFAMSGTG